MRIVIAVAVALFFASSLAGAAKTSKQEAMLKSITMIKELNTVLNTTLRKHMYIFTFTEVIGLYRVYSHEKAMATGRKYDAQIKRVSLRPRNIANAPDGYERKKLRLMERDHAEGTLKSFYYDVLTSPDGKKYIRFMKAIPITSFCLKCHGTQDTLNPSASQTLKTLYPNDRAEGYMIGQVSGAYSVIYPME